MGTNYIAPIWRMPENTNKDKLSNYSINMANANERITLTDGVDLGINSTVSLWVNFSTNNNSVILADDVNPSSSGYFLLLNTSTGDTYVRIGPNFGGSPFNTSWNLNQWYNIIIVRQGGTVELFKDNVSLGTRSGYGTSNTTKFDCIGAKNAGTFPLYGQISQVVGFDYALSTDQRTYLYNLNNPMAITGAEPVAYYPLGDNSNPNANAGYPNISTGTDSVFDFNTTGAWIDCGSHPVFNVGTGDLSISAWVYPTSVSGNVEVCDIGAIGGTRFRLQRRADRIGAYIDSGDGVFSAMNGSTPLSINQWYHFVLVKSGSSFNLYLNGSEVSEASYSNTGSFTDTEVTIGQYFGGTANKWEGELSNIQIWTSALTTVGLNSDLKTLYNNGQPLMTGTQPQEANLQAWYKLNQSANWEADTSGNWQIPDAVSAYPQSFDFNGLRGADGHPKQEIIAPNVPQGQNFTFSCWANFNNPTANRYHPLIVVYSGSTSIIEIIKTRSGVTNANQVYFTVRNASNNRVLVYSNLVPTANEWCHIAGTYDGSNVTIYFNGAAGQSLAQTGDTIASGPIEIGSYYYWNNVYGANFDGQISNVQYFDTALPETGSNSIQTLYNNGTPLTTAIASDNLKAWYKLDNTATFSTNWSIPDASGNGNTGTSSGMTEQNLVNNNVSVLNGESVGMNTTNLVQSNLTRTQPYSNYSMNFDGTQYIDIPDSDSLSFGNGTNDSPFSISAWIKKPLNANEAIISKFGNTGTSGYEWLLWAVLPSPHRIRFAVYDNSNAIYQFREGNTSIDTGEWVHVVATYDGRGGNGTIGNTANQGMKIYINGTEESSYTDGNNSSGSGYVAMHNTARNVQIGATNNVNEWNGQISNTAVFDRVLNEDEILNIYNNGVPQDLQTTSSFSNNLVAWWPMDQRSSYYDGTNWVARDLENGNDGTGINTGNVDDLVGNAPGSDANGEGSNLTIADLKGDMYNSNKNAYSINMGDYADGVTNPADSGRSTNIPSV